MPSVLGRAAQLANQANPGIARLGSPGSPVPAFAVPKPKAPSAPSLLSTPQQMMPPPRPSPASQILASGANASGRTLQANGALVRLYVASADPTPTGTPPASSISEVEAFFLPCLSSTTSRVWKIEVRRDCVLVSVAPEDRDACVAKSGATLGGAEVTVSVATPQQLSAAAAGGRPSGGRPPGVEKERRPYRDGLSYRCGKVARPRRPQVRHPDDAPPLAADDPRRWSTTTARRSPTPSSKLSTPTASRRRRRQRHTPPDAAAAGGAARRKKAAAAAAGEVTVF